MISLFLLSSFLATWNGMIVQAEKTKEQNMAKWGGHQNSKNSNFMRLVISSILKRNFTITGLKDFFASTYDM